MTSSAIYYVEGFDPSNIPLRYSLLAQPTNLLTTPPPRLTHLNPPDLLKLRVFHIIIQNFSNPQSTQTGFVAKILYPKELNNLTDEALMNSKEYQIVQITIRSLMLNGHITQKSRCSTGKTSSGYSYFIKRFERFSPQIINILKTYPKGLSIGEIKDLLAASCPNFKKTSWELGDKILPRMTSKAIILYKPDIKRYFLNENTQNSAEEKNKA